MYILGWQSYETQRRRKDKNMRKEGGSAAVPKIDVLKDCEKFNYDHARLWNSDVNDVSHDDNGGDNRNVNELSEMSRLSTIAQMNDNNNNNSIVECILYMIHELHKLNGNSFLWHASTENVIIGNLSKESSTIDASLNFFDINTRYESLSKSMTPAIDGASGHSGRNSKKSTNSKNSKNSKNKKGNINNNNVEINESKHGLSRDFCSSVMPRLISNAFEETNFRFTPSNRSIIHFWLLFQRIPQIDYYLPCKTRFQHGMLCCFFWLAFLLAQW